LVFVTGYQLLITFITMHHTESIGPGAYTLQRNTEIGLGI